MNLHSTVFFKCYFSQTWQGKSLCFTINFSQKFYIEIHHTCHNLNFLSTAKLGKEAIRDTNASHAWRPTEATQNLGLKASGLEIKTRGQPTKASSHSQSNDFPSLSLHFLHVSLSSGSCQRGAWCCPVRSRPFSNKLLKFLIWLSLHSSKSWPISRYPFCGHFRPFPNNVNVLLSKLLYNSSINYTNVFLSLRLTFADTPHRTHQKLWI